MLARWNPWQELSDLEREMTDLTRRFFRTGPFPALGRQANGGSGALRWSYSAGTVTSW